MLCSQENKYVVSGGGNDPHQLEYSTLFGAIEEFDLQIVKVKVYESEFTSRRIKITHKESLESRELDFMIYSGWNRYSAPSSQSRSIKNLNIILEKIIETKHENPNAPVITQSMSGGGRPGVLQGLYYLYKEISHY